MMKASKVWQIDQVAARTLGVSLGIDLNEERLALVAQHFARHRNASCTWAAQRIFTNLIGRLEAEAKRVFQHQDESWTSGYSFAEHIVATTQLGDALDIAAGESPTKGQVLRRLVRNARKRSLE